MFKQSAESRKPSLDEMRTMKEEEFSPFVEQLEVDGESDHCQTDVHSLEGKLRWLKSVLKEMEKDKLALLPKIEMLEMKLKKAIKIYADENAGHHDLEEMKIQLELHADVLNGLEVKKTDLNMQVQALEAQLRRAKHGTVLSSMREDVEEVEGTDKMPENTDREWKTECHGEETITVQKDSKILPKELEKMKQLQLKFDETSGNSVLVDTTYEKEIKEAEEMPRQLKEEGQPSFEDGRRHPQELNDDDDQNQAEVSIQFLEDQLRQICLNLEQIDVDQRSVELKIEELQRRIKLEKKCQPNRHLEELEVCLESSVNDLNQLEEIKNHIKRMVKALKDRLRSARLGASLKVVHEKEVSGINEDIHWKAKEQEELISEYHEKEQVHLQELEKVKKGTSFDLIPSTVPPRENSSPDFEAHYRKLKHEVVGDLTLAKSLSLALLFGLSEAETDWIRRVSCYELPGFKCLEFLEKHGIISKYDVTHLQKALESLDMKKTNRLHIIPYQEKVDSSQFRFCHSAPNIIELPGKHLVTESIQEKAKGISPEQVPIKTSEQVEGNFHVVKAQKKQGTTELRWQESFGSVCSGRWPGLPYVEEKIGVEGGTIDIPGVGLSIPPGALSDYHLVNLAVSHDPEVNLPKDIDKSKVIALVRLMPLGLMLHKPGQLSIQHTVLIPEVDHRIISVYSGLKSEKDETEINWEKKKSVIYHMKKAAVGIPLHSLSYLCAVLGRRETQQKLIVRAVSFVDGVLAANDDIIFTVCFCKDIDVEYQSLLSDYQSKLQLDGYTTLYMRHNRNGVEENAGFVGLSISSVDSSYLPLTTEKRIASDHICSASRVSHQFRLRKNENIDSDQVNVKLTITQDGEGETEIHFKKTVTCLQVLQGAPPAYTSTTGLG